MDSSDITAKRKQQAVYVDQKNAFVTNNPRVDCSALSTCTTAAVCGIKFPSYENKLAFYAGKNICNDCECPVNNGSR